MNILLVGGHSLNDQDVNSLEVFSKLLVNVNNQAKVQAIFLDNLLFDLEQKDFHIIDLSSMKPIERPDCIFVRGPSRIRLSSAYLYYISRYCQKYGIPCINDYSLYYPGGKFAQNIVFMEHAAPFLQTIYGINKTSLIQAAETTFGYPYILKTNVGSHGDYNYLINSLSDAKEAIDSEPDVDFLAQQYCPNDRDYRLLFVGKEQLIFERRGATDSHINNTSKGGIAQLADNTLPTEIITKAREITHTLGMTISGVDVITNLENGKFYFLEVNSQPQMSTGAFLKEKKTKLAKLIESI